MNMIDNLIIKLMEWFDIILNVGGSFLQKYGFYVVLAMLATAVAKVFKINLKVGK